eukprot:6237955-Alexandrium_andersonii.AAC.1
MCIRDRSWLHPAASWPGGRHPSAGTLAAACTWRALWAWPCKGPDPSAGPPAAAAAVPPRAGAAVAVPPRAGPVAGRPAGPP